MGLTVSDDIPAGVSLLGKTLNELQDVVIGDSSITGTLHYVTDYTGFSGDPAEQEGNYIALYFNVPDVEGVTYTVQLIGGTHPATTLDEDQTCIFRIANRGQKIKVTASKNDDSYTRYFTLGSLTLES